MREGPTRWSNRETRVPGPRGKADPKLRNFRLELVYIPTPCRKETIDVVVKDFLEREGHRVIADSCGECVIAAMEAERIDAVILDKEIPGTSGLDLLSFFRRRFPEIPTILITAFGGSRVAQEAFRRGAARYLEKPFRVTDLLAAVRAVTLDEKRPSSAEGGP